jgi:hypothetical protein
MPNVNGLAVKRSALNCRNVRWRSPRRFSICLARSLSALASGIIVDAFGYSVGFLSLGAVAAFALMVFAVAMPETAKR